LSYTHKAAAALLFISVSSCTSTEGGGRGKKGKDCGVDQGQSFDVAILRGLVFPYKPDSGEPWDWDGDIPDWMIDLTNSLADILMDPTLATAAEILEIVDEVAPLVLDGTTPPDPVLSVVAALDTATTTTTTTYFGGYTYTTTYGTYSFGTLDAQDDTIEPTFDLIVPVDLYPEETLWFDMIDEDLVDDDYVGSAGLSLRDLQDLAWCGPTTLRGLPGSGLYSIDVVVEPYE
jgi:hypothetical protein